SICPILCISSVMATTKSTIMVVYRDQVINHILLFMRFSDSLSQVQTLNWELNQTVQLISTISTTRETLKMDDENIWAFPEFELFGGTSVFLAPWAIPWIILRKNLFLCKLIKAVL